MKNVLNNKMLKYSTCFMILVQGILLSLVAAFYMDVSYFNKLSLHPSSGVCIELKTIPEEKSEDTYRFLKSYAEKNGLFYIRKDYLLDRNDGGVNGVLFSVDGNLNKNKDKLKMEFLGQNILDYNKIKILLDSKEPNATLGIQESSLHSVGDIPRFKFGKNIIFKKLETTVTETKTINGEYKIVGLEDSKKEEFLEGISLASGIDSKVFFDGKSGYSLDHGLMEMILIVLLGLNSLVLLALLVVITIKYLPNLGKFILQGWSRGHFAVKLYQPFIYTSFVSIVFFVAYGLILTNMTFHSFLFMSVWLGVGVINFIIISILLCIASLFIYLVSPINAIRERLPRKKYMTIAVVVYGIFNLVLIAGSVYIDGPYREVKGNIEISKKWRTVSDYRILKRVDIGEDQASLNRQSKKLFEDFYNWYKSIADQDDVNIINTTFVSDDMLKSYKADKVYENIPNEEFWLFTASPNYLEKLGISIDSATLEKAKSGARVYLIPENKSEKEKSLLRGMFKEDDTRSIRKDDIKTTFNDKKEFAFIEYKSNRSMFSWNTEYLDKLMIDNPVILIITPENMIYRESESLIAIGLESSYVKLDGKSSEKYLTSEYLSKFDLDDNNIEFSTVKLFVDGLQKDLWTTIQWFFGLIVSITIIMMMLLVSIIIIFQNSYKEKISVKKFLGYTNLSIYKTPIIFVAIVIIFDVISVVLFESKIGILYMIVMGIIQTLLFYKVMVNNQMKKLNVFLKS